LGSFLAELLGGGPTDARLAALRLLVAGAAAAALLAEILLELRGDPPRLGLQKRVGATLAVAAVIVYFQGFDYGYPYLLHRSEQFHYYMGARYLPELGYERLYTCAAVAEAEGGSGAEVRGRTMRDLRTNRLVQAATALDEAERCHQAFSPARWAAFQQDVLAFRRVSGAEYWRIIQNDHGYNGTPVWALLGGALAGVVPPSLAGLRLLATLDVGLLAAAGGLLAWAFGWRVFCVAIVFWGTQAASTLFWTGGSLLRQDGILCLIAAACLLRRQRPFAAGLLLGYAALARLYPALLIATLGVAALGEWRRRGSLPGRWLSLAAGVGLAAALLLPASVLVKGPGSWVEFVHHIRMHDGTPTTNRMGWRAVVGHHAAGRAALVEEPGAVEPFARWKSLRAARLERLRPVVWGGMAAAAALIGWSAWSLRSAWVTMGVGLLSLTVHVGLTCYYHAFLVLAAPLSRARRHVELALVSVALLGNAIVLRFPHGDDRYAILSLLHVVFTLFVVLLFSRPLPAPHGPRLPVNGYTSSPLIRRADPGAVEAERQVVGQPEAADRRQIGGVEHEQIVAVGVGQVNHDEQPAVVLARGAGARDEDRLADEIGREAPDHAGPRHGVHLEQGVGAGLVAGRPRAGGPHMTVGPGREPRVDDRQFRPHLAEGLLGDRGALEIDGEARQPRPGAIVQPPPRGRFAAKFRVLGPASAVDHEAPLGVLVAVGVVEHEAGRRRDEPRLAALARHDQQRPRLAPHLRDRRDRRAEPEQRPRRVEGDRREKEEPVARRQHEIMDEMQLLQRHARRRVEAPARVGPVEHQPRWLPLERAEVEELAGRGVDPGVRGEGQITPREGPEERAWGEQRAVVILAPQRLQGHRVDAVRDASLPEHEQLAAVGHDARVGRVLEAHPERVGPHSTGQIGAKIPVEHAARGLLLQEFPRPHEAVAVAHPPPGERKAHDHAVAIEGVVVAHSAALHAPGHDPVERAAEPLGSLALDELQWPVGLLGLGGKRAMDDVQQGRGHGHARMRVSLAWMSIAASRSRCPQATSWCGNPAALPRSPRRRRCSIPS
jgi:hypothetical protein